MQKQRRKGQQPGSAPTTLRGGGNPLTRVAKIHEVDNRNKKLEHRSNRKQENEQHVKSGKPNQERAREEEAGKEANTYKVLAEATGRMAKAREGAPIRLKIQAGFGVVQKVDN
jgi:hypothetical protein